MSPLVSSVGLESTLDNRTSKARIKHSNRLSVIHNCGKSKCEGSPGATQVNHCRQYQRGLDICCKSMSDSVRLWIKFIELLSLPSGNGSAIFNLNLVLSRLLKRTLKFRL